MMKKILGTALMVAMIGGFAACGTNNDEVVVTDDMHEHDMDMTAGENVVGPVDPVCGMAHNPDWELFSLYEEDTVWFCAEFCKETFDNDPEKYSVNLVK